MVAVQTFPLTLSTKSQGIASGVVVKTKDLVLSFLAHQLELFSLYF